MLLLKWMDKYRRHYQDSIYIPAPAEEVFNYADIHNNFSSHMNKSSWMMGGSSMTTDIDEGKGQKIGSHIRMKGKVIGITLFLDEVVTKHDPPYMKEWQTVGEIKLLIIDRYKMGFEIQPESNNSMIRIYIDYNLPTSSGPRLLGYLLGGFYARWCVKQMIQGVKEHFNRSSEN